MNKYERSLSICRNTYALLNKKKFSKIGKKSYFMKPIFLSGTQHIEMGEDVGIWHNARVEVIDEWKGKGFSPRLKFGNHINIGQDLHIACAEDIVIEDNVLISSGVFITDLSHVTDDYEKAVVEQGIITKPVKICEGTFIGKDSMIMPGVTLGKHCVVGANAVVTKDVADFTTVAGVPARVIHR
ncbi:MAG: acyltransferase [Lachnospiraceae bacterium]|nr:acyltransferase [Lachnospiraceae bacterium]